jgi:class 3 adenylate cyclase
MNAHRQHPERDNDSLSSRFSDQIRQSIEAGHLPTQVVPNIRSRSQNIAFTNDISIPCIPEERCVLIIDIVGYSKRTMVEQLLLYQTLNVLFARTRDSMTGMAPAWAVWDVYKGQGDGAAFIFGRLLDPISVRHALIFAVRNMRDIINYNNSLHPDSPGHFEVRMALTYSTIYVTSDLEGGRDVVGDAINIASRLSSVKEARGNAIFISNSVYHNMQINRATYFINQDESPVQAGELSDFVIGSNPDANNFLYVTRQGVYETKDRLLEAYNISGRISGTDIIPKL